MKGGLKIHQDDLSSCGKNKIDFSSNFIPIGGEVFI